MSKVPDKLRSAADLFAERNAIYGDNWRNVGHAMAALFPDGVTLKTPEDFQRFHLFELKMVKLSRYAKSFGDGGHRDSIRDDGVYSFLLEAVDEEIFGDK